MDRFVSLDKIMTTPVITVGPLDNLNRVGILFEENNIHHLPVVDSDGKVLGIISKTDYCQLQDSCTRFASEWADIRNEQRFSALLAQDVMTTTVAALHPKDTAQLAAAIFRENNFHALPVVDDGHCLLGIVTTYDLLNFAFLTPKSIAA